MSQKVFFALISALLLVAGVLWYTSRSLSPKQASWEDVVSEAEKGGYKLIRTEELGKRYRENPESLLLVDTRQEWEYRAGHIKGAVNFPMEPTWWSRWRKQKSLERLLGPDKERFVVFY
ncbi:MAG: rhodanese-like domain-containing protein [Deltaproteobacteria bacterium]|nr:rhodanese-like domain-containing protein [Deltaproteobacteria bacterium]